MDIQTLEPMENPLLDEPMAPPPKRLASLDALRGFDMFFMVIGDIAIISSLAKGLKNDWFNEHIMPQADHVPWEGFVAWDLIMPLFLFIVGVAMPFSFAKRQRLGQSKPRIYVHVIFRVIVLWILGMVAQGNLLTYDPSKFAFYSNTLQSIAAGYLIASILLLHFGVVWQVLITVALLMGYWALLILVPVPGIGAGQLTPDGNLAMYIDKLILGPYQDGTTYTWILSSMTFAATVMMGVFAGKLLMSRLGRARKVLFLLASGVACVYIGWAWGHVFPIIKHIWTSSMVLYAGGFSLLLLGLFYFVFDVLPLGFLAFPFRIIGLNAIVIYIAVHVVNFPALANPFVAGLSRWTGDWQDLVRTGGGFVIAWLILLYACIARRHLLRSKPPLMVVLCKEA